MVFDYIAIGVIIVSIGVIIVVVGRKFPVLASISVKELPEHKQAKIKSGIIESRLYRKLTSISQPLVKFFTFAKDASYRSLRRFWNYIRELEKRHQIPEEQLSLKEKTEREEHTKEVLFEGKQLAKDEQYSDAEKKLIEAISLDPDNIDAFTGLGKVYFAMKDYGHACEAFEYALQLEQKKKTQQNRMSGEQASNGSQGIDREIADHHIDLGEVCAEMGDRDKALRCFQQAVKLEPNNPRNLDALYHYAVNIKDKPLAWETLKKLKSANPENQKLQEYESELDNL